MWPMKNGALRMIKDRIEEVDEKKMAAVFSYSYDRVRGAGKLLVSLSPVKVNLVVYLG